ncbi:MAG: sulfatase-like hydrolase/transferase [bacterium]|nr:sulfatase-like hydrolase/transferase [bacterium]
MDSSILDNTGNFTIIRTMKPPIKYIIIGLLVIVLLAVFIVLGPFKSKGDIPDLGDDPPYNLLIITVDALRADHVGVYGSTEAKTPNIDQLSGQGVVFKNCYASVPLALPTHGTIFTGKEPLSHGVRHSDNTTLNISEITLAEVMKSRGFTTHAVIASPVLKGESGLNQGFDLYNDSLDAGGGAVNLSTAIDAKAVYTGFKKWFDENQANGKAPFFSWVHFHDPTAPYNPPEEYSDGFENSPYLGEIAYVDHYIGKIMEALEEKKIKDKTLVILTGGHGEAFGEHNEVGHGIFCYGESLKVPLVFANPVLFPNPAGVASRVRLVDIMPTVLRLFNQEIPAAVQGASIAGLLFKKDGKEAESPDAEVYFESLLGNQLFKWAPVRGIISGSYKYIALPEPELYHLGDDPGELKNLYKEEKYRTEVKTLEQRLKDRVRELSGEVLSLPDASTVDPKRGVMVLNSLQVVNRLTANGKMSDAEQLLEGLIKKNPGVDMPGFYNARFRIYNSRGERAKAKEVLEKGLKQFPGSNRFRMSLAVSFFNEGKVDEARKLCSEVLNRNPGHTRALLLLGRISTASGKREEALSYYEKAYRLDPGNVLVKMGYIRLLAGAGRGSEALGLIDELLKRESRSLETSVNIGFLLLNMREFDKVIALCKELTGKADGSKDPRIWNQLGMAYTGTRKPRKAMDSYKIALELDPKSAFTLNNMGSFYLAMYRVRKDDDYRKWSVDHYTRAIALNPRMVSALNGLAAAHSFSGEYSKAAGYWKRALDVNPAYVTLYFNLGSVYLKMGRKRDALRYLNQCKEKFYSRLKPREQQQLDTLIKQARS